MRFPKIVIDPLIDNPLIDSRAIGWEFFWTTEWRGQRIGGYAHTFDQADADAIQAGRRLMRGEV